MRNFMEQDDYQNLPGGLPLQVIKSLLMMDMVYGGYDINEVFKKETHDVRTEVDDQKRKPALFHGNGRKDTLEER